MAVVEISITPLGSGTSVSSFVAGCVEVLRKKRIPHQLTPMGTILEGELDVLFPVIRDMMEAPFLAGAVRVSTLIKIDDRRDRSEHNMAGKVRAVERHLGGGN